MNPDERLSASETLAILRKRPHGEEEFSSDLDSEPDLEESDDDGAS